LIVNKPADDPRPSIRLTDSVASRRVSIRKRQIW
jgi:hypothetical protein